MKKSIVALTGSLIGLALLAATMNTMPAAGVTQGSHGTSHVAASPVFHHPELLNVDRIRLGMSRDEVRGLHLSQTLFPTNLKFDGTAHVTFVNGTALCEGHKQLTDDDNPFATLHTWGKPLIHETCGKYIVSVYQAGQAMIIQRYEIESLDRRSGVVSEYALSTGVAWVPYDWGHTLIERAGL